MSESGASEVEIKAAKAVIATIAEMASLSRELASFASYAEIVGAFHCNRTPVRNLCDQIFNLNHRLEEELKKTGQLDWMSFDNVAQGVELLSKIEGLVGLSIPAVDPNRAVEGLKPSCSSAKG
jgi:hypothetical protein